MAHCVQLTTLVDYISYDEDDLLHHSTNVASMHALRSLVRRPWKITATFRITLVLQQVHFYGQASVWLLYAGLLTMSRCHPLHVTHIGRGVLNHYRSTETSLTKYQT